MKKTIGFEGVIEGVERGTCGPLLLIKPTSKTGDIPTNMWIIPTTQFTINAAELWNGKKLNGGVEVIDKLLTGKKILFYIKD